MRTWDGLVRWEYLELPPPSPMGCLPLLSSKGSPTVILSQTKALRTSGSFVPVTPFPSHDSQDDSPRPPESLNAPLAAHSDFAGLDHIHIQQSQSTSSPC
ncbi:hypothetical protein BCR34DRAFT_249263 [Clohesyomyces aquaticus]|uniref:Uncharacterized protein n=1 Tax=Clohesyomyces aquaticus TaxID=1231657 RepID=A0A1Y1ZUN3_9PLEO|nr:hypothetical protein BCR34DRAFT_249263 [Clohesyomyces aquaticus]